MNSLPDLHNYQIEEYPPRLVQSVIIENQQHTNRRLNQLNWNSIPNFSLASITINNCKIIGQTIKKTYNQMKNKQQVTIGENIRSSVRETNSNIQQVVNQALQCKPQVKGNKNEKTKTSWKFPKLMTPSNVIFKSLCLITQKIKKTTQKNQLSKQDHSQKDCNSLHSAYNEDALYDDFIL